MDFAKPFNVLSYPFLDFEQPFNDLSFPFRNFSHLFNMSSYPFLDFDQPFTILAICLNGYWDRLNVLPNRLPAVYNPLIFYRLTVKR